MRRDLVTSRAAAVEAISQGLVTIDGAPATKPSTQVAANQDVVVSAPPRRFVSRGGEKLDHALEHFSIDVTGRDCLDAGVSTGGFTDCLLQRGARSVVAFDVGYGQVHERLRQDDRVDVRERTNVRWLVPEALGDQQPQVLVADLSFIALSLVLGRLLALLADDADAEAVVLVKPQFESDRADVGRGGVVRDPQAWKRSLVKVAQAAHEAGWRAIDVTRSPLTGPAGNVEFLLHLVPALSPRVVDDGHELGDGDNLAAWIAAAIGIDDRVVSDGPAHRPDGSENASDNASGNGTGRPGPGGTSLAQPGGGA